MKTTDAISLAQSMRRIYGAPKALTVAKHYASAAAATNDTDSHERWEAVAAIVAQDIAKQASRAKA